MGAEAQELVQLRGPISSFREAVDFIEEGLNYEKSQRWKYNRKWLDLSRMEGLLHAMGDPHRGYNIIHVAGTKGKGSTSGAIAHCLSETGHRTGLLTSPHLVTPCERAVVDDEMIGEEAFWRITRKMQPYVEAKRREKEVSGLRAPTYFEMLTALPFEYLTERNVEWAVVEVGLGGRLDATNVVTPRCCVITAIGFDHTDKLGTTPGCIAAEKAGILKPGVPVILARQQYPGALVALRRAAEERDCPRWEVGRELALSNRRPIAAPAHSALAEVGWHFDLRTPDRNYENLFTPLLGAHQLDNLAAALGALEMAAAHGDLNIDRDRIAAAIASFRIPARVQVLQKTPALVLDVAHTVESITALLEALDTHFPGRRLRLVFGCSADKNVAGMLRALGGRCASLTVTQARLPRALLAAELAGAAREAGVADDRRMCVITDAWEATLATLSEADPDDVVCVTGSFFVAGEVLAGWRRTQPSARH
jgi:dihydrofolate synthase/folylpolyglutamate synthase